MRDFASPAPGGDAAADAGAAVSVGVTAAVTGADVGWDADVGAAVIGTGFIGTVHVEALRRIGVQVRGVLGSTPERGAVRADALGVPRAYDSLDALLADPSVDVVHVTSPNDLHVSQTKAALALSEFIAERRLRKVTT